MSFIPSGLLMARNRVAGYYGNLADHMTLPGMLRDSHVCKYCPYLTQCCLTHKYVHGCAVLLCLVCLFDLAYFFLSFFSHLSFTSIYVYL